MKVYNFILHHIYIPMSVPNKYDAMQNAITNPICLEPGTGSLITTADYTIPCGSVAIGVPVKVEVPIADLTIGQSAAIFDATPPADGEMQYIGTNSKVMFISFKLDLQTTAINPEVIKATVYLNGSPLNGGLQSASVFVDFSAPTTSLSLPVGGGGITTNDILSVYVSNLSSATDVILKANSILVGGYSYQNF